MYQQQQQLHLHVDYILLYSSVSRITELLERLDKAKLCFGNPDEKYFGMQAARKGRFMDSSG